MKLSRGVNVMSKNKKNTDQSQPFGNITPEQQKQYEREARLTYDPTTVNESIKLWNSYTKEKQEAVMAEAGEIYRDLSAAMDAGRSPQDAEVQAIFQRWHQNLTNFYEPTLEILRGLGELYSTDERFIANFKKLHEDLPDYLAAGIAQYVDDLETAELERMLAEESGQEKKSMSVRSSRLSL
jgi:hypothetical protein